MVLLIALVPAVIVFIIVATTRSRAAWFWASLGGLCVAFLGFSTYFFLDVSAVLFASWLAWKTVDFIAPEKPDALREPANWDTPRQTRHVIASGRQTLPSEVSSHVVAEESISPAPTEQELHRLRTKIKAEHKANAVQRERDARRAAHSKNGDSS